MGRKQTLRVPTLLSTSAEACPVYEAPSDLISGRAGVGLSHFQRGLDLRDVAITPRLGKLFGEPKPTAISEVVSHPSDFPIER
jgi:hypothetical protein